MKTSKREQQAKERRDYWRQIVTQQQESGLGVRAFCQQHNIDEHSFYMWRKDLRLRAEVRFALVDPGRSTPTRNASLELVLGNGECVRIGPGVDAATLRALLTILRER